MNNNDLHESETVLDGFAALGLAPALLKSLDDLGYEEPTPIQKEAIPVVLEGHDMIGQAATGTGKTAAFALPLVQRLSVPGKRKPHPSALVLAPTRELALQVAEAFEGYGRHSGLRAVAVYGGSSYDPQIRALRRGVDVVIATPGRALDLIDRGDLVLSQIKTVVLDEADEMLAMGFIDDVEQILGETPDERQVVLFSATLPPRVADVARRYMREPKRVAIASVSRGVAIEGQAPKIKQVGYVVSRHQKKAALERLLAAESPASAIIFCRTRHEVDELSEILNAKGRGAEPLHGGMSQAQRERVIKKLKDGKASLVIATDVAARGLDIDQLSHVINYDVPSFPEAYVHRIGRVGRAGREGTALTLVEPRESRFMRAIENVTKQPVEIGRLPSAQDLKNLQLDQTTKALRESLAQGELQAFQKVIDDLTGEFDLATVALAAIKVAHQALNPGQAELAEIFEPRPRGIGRPAREPRSTEPMTKLHLNMGSKAHIRPGDLVGAITGEAGIAGRQIGAISIGERYAVFEVETGVADNVLAAMAKATIKGQKVNVRRWT